LNTTHYLIARIDINDREGYSEYHAGFMEIFSQYDGKMLSIDEEVSGAYAPPLLVARSMPQLVARVVSFSRKHGSVSKAQALGVLSR
jgi:uncharacterized protein (DUF1330 family)